MHMKVDGKIMPFKLNGGKGKLASVQLMRYDGSHFSFPITTGEAGIYEDETGYYYFSPDPEITMAEVNISSNMYDAVHFRMKLPMYHNPHMDNRPTIILPDGRHMTIGVWRGGVPEHIVRPGELAVLDHCRQTGEPFTHIPPLWFYHHQRVQAWMHKQESEHRKAAMAPWLSAPSPLGIQEHDTVRMLVEIKNVAGHDLTPGLIGTVISIHDDYYTIEFPDLGDVVVTIKADTVERVIQNRPEGGE